MEPVIRRCGHVPRFQKPVLGLHSHQGLELIAALAGQPRWRCDDRVMQVPAGWVYFNLPWQRRRGGIATGDPLDQYIPGP